MFKICNKNNDTDILNVSDKTVSTSGQEQAKPCPASRDVTDQLGCQKMDNGINSQLIVRTYSFQNNTQKCLQI